LQDYVKDANTEGKSHQEIVKGGMIADEAIGGGQVNVKALLAEILNIPEPMVNL
jgi:hypothetical protein